MLNTLGKNRQACVILDAGQTTNYFPLKSGRPQGEIVSPLQYNFGNQIFSFMIELNPDIASVYQHMIGPSCFFPIEQNFSKENKIFSDESNLETDKAKGFADDASISAEREERTFSTVRKVLIDFSKISGLKCNFEKTFSIPVGGG
jgi:hypothetical protein